MNLPADRLLEALALTRTERQMLADLADKVSLADYAGFGHPRTGGDLADELREIADYGEFGWTDSWEEAEVEALAAKLAPLGHRATLCLLARFGADSGEPVRDPQRTLAAAV